MTTTNTLASDLPEQRGEIGPRTADRVAGWHYSITTTNNTRPNSCYMTYKNQTGDALNQHLLAKIVPGIEINGKTIWTSKASNINVYDIPGSVIAEFKLGEINVKTEITPLMVGRGSGNWEGAALYKVETENPTPVTLRIGGGENAFMHFSPVEWIVTDYVDFPGASAKISDNIGILKTYQHPLTVCFNSSGKLSLVEENNSFLASFPDGSGTLLMSFSLEENDAINLIKDNENASRKDVDDYYEKLLSSSYIETPEKDMNDAFSSAIYNLEYNWIEPFGWVESLHHWVTMWHQQHTGAAAWIGQEDRAKQCILETASRAFADGAIPQLSPAGLVRRDFGGSNQFYAWQIRNYWNQTGDVETIKKVANAIYNSIEQTFNEYDHETDGLLSWGLQIGNQEDFILTPYNGTAPTVEGINMLRTGAIVARIVGDNKKADNYERRVNLSIAKLKSTLWKSDLGRFIYYVDPFGVERLDSQYHTYIYPVIFDILDNFDSWTSMRYLRDRLMGDNGETYVSNHFPDHLADTFPTWGMQAGAAQQPWAAWGLSEIGLRNETYKPLRAISQVVMNDFQKGSWPEVAYEYRMGYFSPPAGVFIQSVIEALFGLTVNKPEGHIQIAPSIPDEWNNAKLVIPDYKVEYKRNGNTFKYILKTSDSYSVKLRWKLEPCKVTEVLVNNKKVSFETQAGINYILLEANLPSSNNIELAIKIKPINYEIIVPKSIAEGDNFSLQTKNLEIMKIDDRCGVLSSFNIKNKNKLEATISSCLLDKYESFGKLGQMTFSRRTFFLHCKKNDIDFWIPVDLNILPRYEVAPIDELSDKSISILVRNNTLSKLENNSYVLLAGEQLPFKIDIPPRSQKEYTIPITSSILENISPGDNSASLVMQNNNCIDFKITANKVLQHKSEIQNNIVQITLPEADLKSSRDWMGHRKFYSHHAHWRAVTQPLKYLADKPEITVPNLPNVKFKTSGEMYIPVSRLLGKSDFTINLDSIVSKKVYLLVLPLIDNHDMYCPIARITLLTNKGAGEIHTSDGMITKTLFSPGDLDWMYPTEAVGKLASHIAPRENRSKLLPILDDKTADWNIAKPPLFPQPEYWSTTLPYRTNSSVMGVIEIDLPKPMPLRSLSITALTADAAIGVVAVSVEKAE
ncbi:MAG: hypothetical protein SNJ70_05110 [Armatimonadota bacterium]